METMSSRCIFMRLRHSIVEAKPLDGRLLTPQSQRLASRRKGI
jgi:hypothetical protein